MDGAPLEDVDGMPIDGAVMDGAPLDGAPLEDLDGVPIKAPEEDLDGVPCEWSSLARRPGRRLWCTEVHFVCVDKTGRYWARALCCMSSSLSPCLSCQTLSNKSAKNATKANSWPGGLFEPLFGDVMS